MKNILKYDNNLSFNDGKNILNIYKIATPSILKYAREKIYRIFILTLIREDFKSILKFIRIFFYYRNIFYFYYFDFKYKRYYKNINFK